MRADRLSTAHHPLWRSSPILVLEDSMRMTIDVDDELLARAEELTGISERSALIRDAVELLVRIETGRQLAALGGSDQVAEAVPRSREHA